MPSKIIEGKRAREYDSKRKSDDRQILFDNFLLGNLKGRNTRICELACGPGNNISLLKGSFIEYWATDLSKEMIMICKEKFAKDKKAKFKLASATDTGLASGYFDYILIRMGLHHIKEKELVMNEAYRLLKKGGKFLVVDKFYLSRPEMYIKGIIKLVSHGNTSAFGEYLLPKEGYEKVFSSKFKVIKREYTKPSFNHIGQAFMYVLEK